MDVEKIGDEKEVQKIGEKMVGGDFPGLARDG